MYIVTFHQEDAHSHDSSLCANSLEVFKTIEKFFQENRIEYPEDFPTVEEPEVIGDYLSIGVGCYTTIHIQKLNAYSREQLSLVSQQTQLTTSDSYVVSFTIDGGDSLDSFVVKGNLQEFLEKKCNEIDSENESTNYTDSLNESNVNFKENSLDTQRIWVDIGEYIYIQKSRVVISKQSPLAPIKPYKIILHFRNGEPTVTRVYETIEDAQWAFNTFYMRRPNKDEIEYKAEGWNLEEKPQGPLKPFVVAATLPDYSQVILGRFDSEADQKMFEMNCSLYSYEDCKCGVCGKVLGDDDEIYTDYYSSALLCDSHSRFNEATNMYEATEGDLERRLRDVIVVLEDNNHFTTSITGTKKTIEEYFPIGSTVNMGVAEDSMVAIKELIFIEDEANQRYAKLQEDRQRAAQRIFEEAERKEFEEWHEQTKKESTFRFPKI